MRRVCVTRDAVHTAAGRKVLLERRGYGPQGAWAGTQVPYVHNLSTVRTPYTFRFHAMLCTACLGREQSGMHGGIMHGSSVMGLPGALAAPRID